MGKEQSVVSYDLSFQERVKKPSRIPDSSIVFVQKAFAAGADEKLTEEQRLSIAHAVTKPDHTLEELAPFFGSHTVFGAHKKLKRAYKALWEASPPELKQQVTLVDLSRRIRRGTVMSSETRFRMSKAKLGKKRNREARNRMSAGQKRRYERERQREAELAQNKQKRL